MESNISPARFHRGHRSGMFKRSLSAHTFAEMRSSHKARRRRGRGISAGLNFLVHGRRPRWRSWRGGSQAVIEERLGAPSSARGDGQSEGLPKRRRVVVRRRPETLRRSLGQNGFGFPIAEWAVALRGCGNYVLMVLLRRGFSVLHCLAHAWQRIANGNVRPTTRLSIQRACSHPCHGGEEQQEAMNWKIGAHRTPLERAIEEASGGEGLLRGVKSSNTSIPQTDHWSRNCVSFLHSQ